MCAPRVHKLQTKINIIVMWRTTKSSFYFYLEFGELFLFSAITLTTQNALTIPFFSFFFVPRPRLSLLFGGFGLWLMLVDCGC